MRIRAQGQRSSTHAEERFDIKCIPWEVPVGRRHTDLRLVHACIRILRTSKACSAGRRGGRVASRLLKDLGSGFSVATSNRERVHVGPDLLRGRDEISATKERADERHRE